MTLCAPPRRFYKCRKSIYNFCSNLECKWPAAGEKIFTISTFWIRRKQRFFLYVLRSVFPKFSASGRFWGNNKLGFGLFFGQFGGVLELYPPCCRSGRTRGGITVRHPPKWSKNAPNPKKFRLRRALKTSFLAFSDTFTDAIFCMNFFGNEHFHLSILVDCIVHRLEHFCGRLAVNSRFCNYRNVPMLLAKRLIIRARAVPDVLWVQERGTAIRKTVKTSCARRRAVLERG